MAGNSPKHWKAQGDQLDALEQLLADQTSDEKGGVDGALGFTFQQWWAAFVVVELLEKENDFAVGMEVKEDVAILDSPIAPSQVEFCQVKKNERQGAWTLNGLQSVSKASSKQPGPSTLAKLYGRRHQFSGHPTKLRFVSNVGFKVPADDGSEVHTHGCTLNDLDDATVAKIKKRVSQQLSISEGAVDLSEFRLHRTNLPLGEQHLMVGGKLGELCNTQALPFSLERPAVAARMLAFELQNRTSNTSFAKTFAELRERLLSRTDALHILSTVAANAKAPIQAVLEKAIARLNAETYDFLAVRQMEKQIVPVCADAVDRTNLMLRDLVKTLSSAKEIVIANASPGKLGALLDAVLQIAKSKHPELFLGLAPGYPEVVTLLVLNDAITIDVFLVAADPQSEEEA